MEASKRTYLESLSKGDLVNLLCQKDGKIAELEACILKLRLRLYGGKCERNLPSDPNAVQLTLDLFTGEENAEAQERLKKIEEEEAKKLVSVPENKRNSGKRTIDYSSLDVIENVSDPQEVLDAPEDSPAARSEMYCGSFSIGGHSDWKVHVSSSVRKPPVFHVIDF